jgi:hypothetical protein
MKKKRKKRKHQSKDVCGKCGVGTEMPGEKGKRVLDANANCV